MTKGETKYNHESYGTIGVHHIHGRGESLFGSSIKHSELIRINISHADLRRDLHSDHIYSTDTIVVVDLSYSQFAEFVTTSNMGTGIPCTIRRIGNRMVEAPPFFNKREIHAGEFKRSTDKIASKLDELYSFAESLLRKPSVTKQERKELLERVRYARQCIASDLPFAVKMFDEQMDHSVKEAKGEIEGFALRRLILAGMASLEATPRETPPSPALEYDVDAVDDNRGANAEEPPGTPIGRDSPDNEVRPAEDRVPDGDRLPLPGDRPEPTP